MVAADGEPVAVRQRYGVVAAGLGDPGHHRPQFGEDGHRRALLLEPGTPVAAAVAGFLLDRYAGFGGDPARQERQAVLARLVTASPALQARERRILARYAATLREHVARELGVDGDEDDLRPQVIAEALLAAHGVVIGAFRRATLSGAPPEAYAPRVLASAREAFGLLDGLH